MPATNQAGYPYPLGTDPVAQGDDAIKALAAALPWIQTGSGSAAGDGTNARAVAITFPKAFPGAPTFTACTCSTGASTSATTQVTSISGVSATGMTVNVTRNNTTTVSFTWMAVWLGGGIP